MEGNLVNKKSFSIIIVSFSTTPWSHDCIHLFSISPVFPVHQVCAGQQSQLRREDDYSRNCKFHLYIHPSLFFFSLFFSVQFRFCFHSTWWWFFSSDHHHFIVIIIFGDVNSCVSILLLMKNGLRWIDDTVDGCDLAFRRILSRRMLEPTVHPSSAAESQCQEGGTRTQDSSEGILRHCGWKSCDRDQHW